MRIDLNAKVATRDGQDAGSVQSAIIDPKSNDVAAFVISTGGLFGRDVVVPREELEQATSDGNRLTLRLTKEELERMPEYAPINYAAAPESWIPPADYGYPGSAYLWPMEAAPQVTVPPPSEGAIDQGQVAITKGATVIDRDGNNIGAVDEVRLDPDTGEVQSIVVRLGNALVTLLGGGQKRVIPDEMIDRVEHDAIYLSIGEDEFKRAA